MTIPMIDVLVRAALNATECELLTADERAKAEEIYRLADKLADEVEIRLNGV